MSAPCPSCGGLRELDGKSCSCGWKAGRAASKGSTFEVDRYCPFNDFGTTCGIPGSLSDAMNGAGPWYCPRHFWLLKGRVIRPETPLLQVSYRERWYLAEGSPYVPAPQTRAAAAMAPARQREPGDDEEFIAA